ncbi:gamma-glutamyl cyclotransferase [Massilia sp. Root351]|uniref:gamma-glutamylcyclotransferase n=1 Tax=Massilia sp. Root351 TaxID=1736522 RepID=UPI00070C5C19|nr:gamma-glutamylcyclotransferase [Massilia sp. Root351]KQV85025.1 gamma-glutamyl cyclotransferase [Massilia sp. Root351]
MSANTIEINRQMDKFAGHHSVWVFGYGSLIYKADFPYLQRRPASIAGWSRRFWQGSHDHRGTPAAPGRVVTIIPEAGAICHGMAYLITPAVFEHLDYREKNGYLRVAVEMAFDDADAATAGAADAAEGVVYVAREDNEAFLGEASEEEIARHIARSAGPSGPNSDYLTHLAIALRELGKHDAHVFTIEQYLLELIASNT